MRRSKVGTVFLTLLVVACARESASTLFQPTLEAADSVARQRHGGDLIVFVSDGSSVCRQVRSRVFGATPIARFIAANFAAVEVPAGSDAARKVFTRYTAPEKRPQIIIVSDRLDNLRIHVLRLDKIKEERLLEQLRAVKQAKTVDDYRRSVVRQPPAGR